MPTNIGTSTSYIATVPSLSESADIQVALRLLGYGSSSEPANDAAIATNSVFGKIRDLTTTVTGKANTADPTFTGTVILPTATASVASVRIPTGTVPSTSNQQFGMISAAAESIQLSTTKTTGAGPGFGFIRAPQMVYAVTNSTSTNTSTPVSPFATANDVLSSLEVGKAYRFRGTYYLTSGGTGNTIQLLFAFSNAPVVFKYNYKTYRATGQAAFELVGQSATNGATTVSASVAAVSYVVEFEGFFTSNATTASTLTPQFQMNVTGASVNATSGSFFEIEKLGTSTQTLIAGNWA
jgi:hypothetical protein